ncbi:glycosyl transferase family 2 [Spirochaetia bacterium]|nr:glycosyl transferase family 2 [Spirochaetia bacterium]
MAVISIIIPIYNIEKYLRRCLDSVLAQTFTDYECILVDDGSPDNCPAICDEYIEKDSRFKVIHKENGGLSDARNVGIYTATGDWLVFLDGDDLLYDKLVFENLIGFIKRNNVSTIFCTNQATIENDSITHLSVPQLPSVLSINRFFRQIVRGKFHYLTAWSFVCTREFIIAHNLYFEKGLLHEDEEWLTRILLIPDSIGIFNNGFILYCTGRTFSIMNIFNPQKIEARFLIINKTIQIVSMTSDRQQKNILNYLAARNLFVQLGDKNSVSYFLSNTSYISDISEKIYLLRYSNSVRAYLVFLFVRIFGIRRFLMICEKLI